MKELLELARESIRAKIFNEELVIKEEVKKKFSKKRACFVTLTLNGQLRGCIGSLEPRQELWEDVVENAKNAAFEDPRFNFLTKSELEEVKIEISILSIPKKISYSSEEDLEKKILGKGVIIKKRFNQATYLPQVWEQLLNFEDFISSLCEKAGLSSNSWKELDLEVWVYSVESIEEK